MMCACFCLHFILRFWNQILICLSVNWRRLARSIRRGRHKYLLILNSFSNSINCTLVYAVLDLFWLTPSFFVVSSVMKNYFFRMSWKFKCDDETVFFIRWIWKMLYFFMHIFPIERWYREMYKKKSSKDEGKNLKFKSFFCIFCVFYLFSSNNNERKKRRRSKCVIAKLTFGTHTHTKKNLLN